MQTQLTIGRRIAAARKRKKMTQSELGEHFGVSSQAVSGWERGAVRPDPDKMPKLARLLGVDLSLLLPDDSEARRVMSIEEAERGDHAEGEVRFAPGDIRELDVRAGMGGGGFAEGEVRHDGTYADSLKPETWHFPQSFVRHELRAPADRIIIIETQGDSMSPTIEPGERVVVDTGHHLPSPDGIYALRDRFGAIQVKRLQVLRTRGEPKVRIISDNRNHAPEDVGLDEIEIVGRVICGLKRF